MRLLAASVLMLIVLGGLPVHGISPKFRLVVVFTTPLLWHTPIYAAAIDERTYETQNQTLCLMNNTLSHKYQTTFWLPAYRNYEVILSSKFFRFELGVYLSYDGVTLSF